MSIEHRRSCTGSAPHVTKRLCATIVFFIGIICILGGYLLGRMARSEVKRSNDIVSINLTIAADNLFRKSKEYHRKRSTIMTQKKWRQKYWKHSIALRQSAGL